MKALFSVVKVERAYCGPLFAAAGMKAE